MNRGIGFIKSLLFIGTDCLQRSILSNFVSHRLQIMWVWWDWGSVSWFAGMLAIAGSGGMPTGSASAGCQKCFHLANRFWFLGHLVG